MNDSVKEFWENQAEEHGASDLATAPDHFYRDLEIRKIIQHLNMSGLVLDIGCGNGYSTFKFAKASPSAHFCGIDYSPKMIDAAVSFLRDGMNIDFTCGDVCDLSLWAGKADTIISERCLINLKDWKEQQYALMEMREALKPGGKIIFVENFLDGLENLNTLRQAFGLPLMEVRWHNCYLPKQAFLEFAAKHFFVDYEENIGNLYYIISRVVYAAYAKQAGAEICYGHPLNEIAAQLPTLGIHYEPTHLNCDYSPNYLFILRKPLNG